MADGWPIFAEWKAREALPHYGGNKIPDSYLDKFNARTDAWLVKVGARQPQPQRNAPDDVARFLEDL